MKTLQKYISEIIAQQTHESPRHKISSQYSGGHVASTGNLFYDIFYDNYWKIREVIASNRANQRWLWSEFDAYDIYELKKNVKQLSKWNVIRPLGCGIYKCAFLLSNDHVLSFGTTYQDEQIYEKLMDDLHSGRAARKDIGIFDFKKLTRKMFYVEMSRVVTLHDWMVFTRKIEPRTRSEQQLELIVSLIRETVENLIRRAYKENKQLNDINAAIDKNIFKLMHYEKNRTDLDDNYYKKISSITEILKPKEIKELARTFAYTAMIRGLNAVYDLHSKNIGVDMQDPTKFIPFDID